ncbi:amidohydrolase family protein [Pseudoflavonifractor phocaeensis]|uniref:amidohydrolase family protein n=1 Tax=Pseudoflavonifractor phocaeensis TaxID=1870988 RepID=UPI001958EAB6|nr:amidohydrolase [Pseudoflavonifractor phocaeensis]MBM6926794.1 amidohydrolase [Pseudoflavonifractor phocaeensis]
MSILIHNCTAVLMDEAGTVMPNAYVVVEGTKIRSVGTERPWGPFDQEIDGKGNVLMPGFVNAHTHVPMTAMRGYGDGNNLQDWLNHYIFPVEARWDDRAIRCCTDLGLAEMIASGVTSIADMYMHTDVIAQEVAAAGISANLSCGGVQFCDGLDPATHLDCVIQRELTEKWHNYNDGQIRIDASIHAEYTSRKELWQWMADYAREHDLGMHVHISETQAEHQACLDRHGKTPIQTLNDYGVWDTRAIAAHCVWTTPEDWAIMAEKGISVIHNPISNLKLGSGIAPVPAMKKAGVNVCLGTDGVSSNNCTDFFSDLKFAAILHNGANHDPLALLPLDALKMATRNGGIALGRQTGVIQGGYDADLILVDFSHLNLTPCHSVISNLAYAAHGSDVVMNMARGKVIYKDGDFLTIDLERVRREVADYALPLLFENR